MTLAELAPTLKPDLTESDRDVLRRVAATDWRNTRLELENDDDQVFAAHATALGAALFYSFANFCAIAAHPRPESVQRVNLMKGRPIDQVGSVTTTRDRIDLLFDWEQLPDGITRDGVRALIDDLYSRGPMGFRGPAAAGIPAQVTSLDGGVLTTQIIAPGYRCPSNALIGLVLDEIGEDYLFITSANVSKGVTGKIEAAHYDLSGMQDDFGDREGIVLIGHADEEAVRQTYPDHLPMSTSIVAFHKPVGDAPALLLERHGSLAADDVRDTASKHGFDVVLGERAHERLPMRD